MSLNYFHVDYSNIVGVIAVIKFMMQKNEVFCIYVAY